MARKVARLSGVKNFRELRSPHGRGRSGPLKVAYRRPEGPGGGAVAAVGYTITRRCGGAVERNRIRRRLRACVDGLDLAPGRYLITAMPEAGSAGFAELAEALAEACAKAQEAAA